MYPPNWSLTPPRAKIRINSQALISQPFIVQIMTSELTCSSYNIAVLTPESPKFEAPRQGKITSQLYRVPLLPHIDQVILSPAI